MIDDRFFSILFSFLFCCLWGRGMMGFCIRDVKFYVSTDLDAEYYFLYTFLYPKYNPNVMNRMTIIFSAGHVFGTLVIPGVVGVPTPLALIPPMVTV